MAPRLKRLSIALVAVAAANFLAFFVISLSLGGDALNGKVDGDHYFLGSHGRYREVPRRIFDYSRWHAFSLWVTHPLALLAIFGLSREPSGAANAPVERVR